jgi:hypothetical protein
MSTATKIPVLTIASIQPERRYISSPIAEMSSTAAMTSSPTIATLLVCTAS